MAPRGESRQFARVEVKWPAIVIVSDTQIAAETEDISEIGVCIYCQELPPLEEEFRLEIQPPNRQSLLVTVKAVWTMPADSDGGLRRFAVGAEFEYITENDIRFLGEVVASHLERKD